MRLASEAFRAFNEQSVEGSKPAQLPDAVLQLLPKTLYRGEGSSNTPLCLCFCCQAPELPHHLPYVPGTT